MIQRQYKQQTHDLHVWCHKIKCTYWFIFSVVLHVNDCCEIWLLWLIYTELFINILQPSWGVWKQKRGVNNWAEHYMSHAARFNSYANYFVSPLRSYHPDTQNVLTLLFYIFRSMCAIQNIQPRTSVCIFDRNIVTYNNYSQDNYICICILYKQIAENLPWTCWL